MSVASSDLIGPHREVAYWEEPNLLEDDAPGPSREQTFCMSPLDDRLDVGDVIEELLGLVDEEAGVSLAECPLDAGRLTCDRGTPLRFEGSYLYLEAGSEDM